MARLTPWTFPKLGEVGVSAASEGDRFRQESIAAFVWFSLVTWLMLKTGNFWDCFVAHSVTNLLLGVYILWQGAWHLW